MNNKYFLFLIVILFSCEQEPKQIFGTWFHLGLNQTENTYYDELKWNSVKSEFLNLETNPNPTILNQRTDLYEKLDLKKGNTFTSQLFDLKTNLPFDGTQKGTWKLENNNLILTIKQKNEELKRIYLVQEISKSKLALKIIREVTIEKGKQNTIYDLSNKEKSFNGIVNEIGIDKNEFLSESGEYFDDFWEFRNFGKYQVLSRWLKQGDDISKYSESIKDIINGSCWNYMPYYDPIFENTNQRLIFNKNRELIIRYGDLSSRSGGCGTLSNEDYKVDWEWNKGKNTITINFNNKEKIPFEILSLFREKELKTAKFKIIAKNDKVMIWENIE